MQQVSSLVRQPPGVPRVATPPLKAPHPPLGSGTPSPPVLHTPPKLQRPGLPTQPNQPVRVCVCVVCVCVHVSCVCMYSVYCICVCVCVCVSCAARASPDPRLSLTHYTCMSQGDVQASMPKLTPLDPLKQPSPSPAPLPISGMPTVSVQSQAKDREPIPLWGKSRH